MAEVNLENVEKRFGETWAVAGIDLTVHDQEFVILVGPSGCGKTTTLRMIAGLEDVSAGDIRIGGRSVVNLPPRKMAGEVSEGMLFDIGYADGIVPALAVPEVAVPNGARAG